MTYEAIVYRDIWADDLRLLIDGRDYTYFRNALVQLGGYQLQEPYAFGPADFMFPQVTQFEVANHGVGELRGFRHGARAQLVPVVDGAYGERVWAGFVTTINAGPDGTALHCDGDLSGRLALRSRQPPVFLFTKDIGLLAYDALLHCGINMLPYLGPDTGIERSNIGGGGDQLAWVDELLAGGLTPTNQWTIGRLGKRYEMRLKDFTTVHATVFLGAEGVELDVTRDLQEEPTTIYGTGTDPRGQKITNPVAPNLLAGQAADYPFANGRTFGIGTTDADTDTGAGMYALQRKLVGQGFMTREEGSDNLYDDETEDAVRALQRRAHLPVTGEVNPATWRALFNVTVTGRRLYGARILPMAELDETQRFFLTSNGSVDTANPAYDAQRIKVDFTIDHGGGVWKKDMLKFSDRYLNRIHSAKNWVGTLALNGADLFAGNVTYNTANPTPISRLDIREGWNIRVVGFDGTTQFHVSGVNVDGERNVRLAVDTRARDLLTLGQIIARNKESRRHPAREFINSIRRPNAIDTSITWSEIGGVLDGDQRLRGNRWNRVTIPAGQSGSVDRVRLHLRDDKAAFVCAILDKAVSPSHMAAIAGTAPLTIGTKWEKPHVQDRLKKELLCLYSAGQRKQPLGYYPGQHWADDDTQSDAPITGDWEDDAGFAFHTLGHGVLHLMIFPDRDCTLKAGQLLYPNFAEGS